MAKSSTSVSVGGHEIAVSNPDKVLYPRGRFTKAQVIDYYVQISPFILPHLKNRPVTLKRFPDSVQGDFFYEKDAPSFTPKWVKTFPVQRRSGGADIRYILINDLPTLIWLANLANLEIHPFLHRVPYVERPTAIVFHLDPGEGASLLTCIEVAFLLRELLAKLKLESLVKVSGSKGLHVYVPLNISLEYKVVQLFAKAVAYLLQEQHPDLVISKMAKRARLQKVFIDWSQNAEHKTTVGVYSLRAKSGQPFVSLPVTWRELESVFTAKKPERLSFVPKTAVERVKRLGDLFAPLLTLKQHLPRGVEKASTATHSRTKNAALREYERKRDFSKTAEPAPGSPKPSRRDGKRRFVVQKHAASHLQYDFRLDMHDALKSWAVPKGPPYIKGEKRLAMATEDHPLAYLDFEGIIPKGQYGGGTVMVWDIGSYELIEGNYYKGFLRLHLTGKKLKGEWILTHCGHDEKNKWYLIKADEDLPSIPPRKENSSAISGHTMDEIAASSNAVWQSNRTHATSGKR
jgi:bifunctional non-homologous end joining protein LigD